MRNIYRYAPAGLAFAAHGAAAMELDTLIPAGIPGLGQPTPLSVISRAPLMDQPLPIQFGGLSIDPRLAAGAGYDSAPNGAAAGTQRLSLQPSLAAADPALGFGAYAGGNLASYPATPSQNTQNVTLAAGEEAVLAQQTLSLAGGYVQGDETGFALSAIALPKPVAYNFAALTAGDKITAGMFTLAPQLSVADARFNLYPAQNFTQLRGRFGLDFTPGGPARLVTLFEATQSQYRNQAYDSGTYTALAGIEDDATGLWDFRALAGAALRLPRTGAVIAAPVLEAAATWLPTELDNLSASVAREIDDPDQIGPTAYTLTQASLSYTHEATENIDLSGLLTASNAAYFGSRQTETLFNAGLTLAWHVNSAIAFDAGYTFNDRQANFLPAANEHTVTFSAVWTP
jgi:hypothetical protein